MRLPDLSDAEFELIQEILADDQAVSIAAQDNERTRRVSELIQKFYDARRPATRKTRLMEEV